MYIIGFSSNGEFNSMRATGYTRPLSVLSIRSTVRAKYGRLSEKTMLAMLTPKGKYCSHCPNDNHVITMYSQFLLPSCLLQKRPTLLCQLHYFVRCYYGEMFSNCHGMMSYPDYDAVRFHLVTRIMLGNQVRQFIL